VSPDRDVSVSSRVRDEDPNLTPPTWTTKALIH
jgi:hypothetical protein